MTNPVTLTVDQGDARQIVAEPFASLEAALVKSRQFSNAARRVIEIRGGKYFLEQTLVLDCRDRGLTICSQPGGTNATLIGGRLVRNWQPDGARFWSADLPEVRDGKWDFRLLLVNGRLARRARFPATGFFQNRNEWKVPWMSTTGGGWQRKPTEAELITMLYDPKDLGAWLDISNAEITVYHMWDESAVGIAALDAKANRFTFRNPAGHPPGAFGVHKYVVWNVKEGLTEPGQWFLDRTRGKLVYWPLAGEDLAEAEVIAPVAESIIHIAGTREQPAQGIALRRLTLTVADPPLKAGGFGAGAFAGALEIACADDSEIDELTIANVGGWGIRERGSTNLVIGECQIHHTGAGGIKFDGGVKIVRNNRIHHVGVLYPSAIALWGGGKESAGSLIAHNEIHDTPYTAIACGGNNHRLEGNLIYRAMQELHDGAGIYITFCKNITVRANFVREIIDTGSYGASAYYLDEQAENCLVEGNLALNVAIPSHNHMAKNNTLRNNVFVAKDDLKLSFAKCADYTLERNVILSKGRLLFSGTAALARLASNVFFSAAGAVKGVELDGYAPKGKPVPLVPRAGTVLADPLLAGTEDGKIVFKPESPAAKAGIQPLDVSGAGIEKSKPSPHK